MLSHVSGMERWCLAVNGWSWLDVPWGMILEKKSTFPGKKSKTLEKNIIFLEKQFKVPGSVGPLVLSSLGPLGPLVPWSLGPLDPLVPYPPHLLILVLYPSHPLISQMHPNQPEIDPKTNSRQYFANNTKCCR